MLKEFLGYIRGESRETRSSESSQGDDVPEIEGDQCYNPYDEIQILPGHKDLVHFMTRIADDKVLTAGHDNTIFVWCCKSGQLIFSLEGHKKPLIFATRIQFRRRRLSLADDEYEDDCIPAVITVASDKLLKVWSLNDGTCIKTVREHDSVIKFMTPLNTEPLSYCSGGQDICLWDSEMNLLVKHKRNSAEYIQCIIPVKDHRIVLNTDKPDLLVYEILKSDSGSEKYEVDFYKEIKAHRESVTGLVTITDSTFASTSLDGTIIVWTSYFFSATKKFNHYEVYLDQKTHAFTYSVRYVFVLEQRYIFVTIASGFAVYDSLTGRCLVKVTNAHHAQINHMVLVNDGYLLATCSTDGTVRLWGAPTPMIPSDIKDRKEALLPLERLIGKRIKDLKDSPLALELIGECAGHSGSVQLLVDCGSEGFISSGTDGVIILWKDGAMLRDKRDKLVKKIVSEIGLFDH